MTRRHVAWIVIPALALTLTACTGSEGEAALEGQGGEQNETPNSTTDTLVEVTDTPGSVDGFVGAIDDAEIVTCESQSGVWVGEGTVTNPTDTAQNYRVYVSFNHKGNTRGLVQVDVENVAAGEQATWATEAALLGAGLECVLRVERFEP